jgi:outer membrane biosynthesis protein TonB
MALLSRSLLALLLALAFALGAAACGGSSDLLSGATASQISANLDQVRELVAEGDCTGAEEAVGEVGSQVEGLEGVNPELKEALSDATRHLGEVVAGCEEAPEVTSEPQEEPEEEEPARKPKHEAGPEKTTPEKEPTPPEEEKTEPSKPSNPEETETAPAEPESPSGGVGPGKSLGEG